MAITKVVGAGGLEPDGISLGEQNGTIIFRGMKFVSGNSITESKIEELYGIKPADYNNFGLFMIYIAGVSPGATNNIVFNETPNSYEYIKVTSENNSGSRTYVELPSESKVPYLFNASTVTTRFFIGRLLIVRYNYTSDNYQLMAENSACADNTGGGDFSRRIAAWFGNTKPTFNITFEGVQYFAFMPIRFV